MRGATVCTGIAAPEVSAPWIDWRWGAEIDAHASAVLAARHPSVRNLGDMTRITADAEQADIIVAGTPCQDFSVAGLRAGLTGERGNLTLEFIRLLGELRPRWFVLENVPGLLSMDRGRAFGAILGALAHSGYRFAYRVLDAQYFGVPQRRQRVFIVGYLGDWRPPAAVLFERESLCGHPAPRREPRQAVARPIASSPRGGSVYRNDADTAENLVARTLGVRSAAHPSGLKSEADHLVVAATLGTNGGRGYDDRGDPTANLVAPAPTAAAGTARKHGHGYGQREFETPGFLLAFGGNNTSGPIDVATARNAHGGSHGRLDFETETFVVADPMTAPYAKHGGASAGKDSIARNVVAFKPSHYTRGKDGAPTPISPPLSADADKGDQDPLIVAFSGRARGDDGRGYDRPPQSIVDRVGALETVKPWNVASASAVRRLTPRECERLQGLPDDYTLVPWGKKSMADGPRYRMIGNSMAVPVIGWILDRVRLIDEALS